ncbi:MAG: hypothetical protein Q7W02_27230 [Candidatus Rokubacteria bacterium]|nr:hypothetical protein [Candidatus Rokubacteria bacterium]
MTCGQRARVGGGAWRLEGAGEGGEEGLGGEGILHGRNTTAKNTISAEMTMPIRKIRRSTNWTMLR